MYVHILQVFLNFPLQIKYIKNYFALYLLSDPKSLMQCKFKNNFGIAYFDSSKHKGFFRYHILYLFPVF